MEQNNDINSVSHEASVTLPHYENIRKATMGETYQYFKKLIETKTISNLNECINTSTELSLFDESLQLLLIDHLRLEKEVFKILLSQNENQIKRVLHCKWYFQNLPAELCTKQIFPYVSYSLRCKIINKLSRHLESTEEAEKYVTFIRANYDNARAEYILPRCSPEFILAYIKENNCTFDHNRGMRVLQNFCKRYPEIGIHILSNIFEMNKDEPYNIPCFLYKKVMQYLAGYHPDLMAPFIKKYILLISSGTFGIKVTKKLGTKLWKDLFPDLSAVRQDGDNATSVEFLIRDKSEIVEKLIFHEKTLFSFFSFESKVSYIVAIVHFRCQNLSSQSWSESDHQLAGLLKLVPRDKRLELIDTAFKILYNVHFIEFPKCWSSKVLESLPTETRTPYAAKLEEYAEAGVPVFRKNVGYNCFSPDNPEAYLYLYNSSLAFEKCRELLRKAPSVNKRENIAVQLVKSCWINKDVKVLEEVVEFITTRHRNDHTVIFRFVEAILNDFPRSELNSNIFEKLDAAEYFCYLKGQKNDYIYSQLMENHMHHRLEHNMDVETIVKRYFDYFLVKSYMSTLIQDFRGKHSKCLILLLSKELVQWIQNKSKENPENPENPDYYFMKRCLVTTCMEYNKQNKNERILFEEIPGLVEILRKETKETYGKVGGEEWSLNVWEKYENNTTSAYHKPRILFYVFKRSPHLVEKYLEEILKIMFYEYFREYNEFFIFLKKTASFMGKTEKMKEIILDEFKNGESTQKRKTALLFYSYMCTTEEFSKTIESYLPKKETLEPGATEDFHEIQMYAPRLIKNVKPRSKNLDLVLKFFFGDFLKSVLSSFYKCCFYTRCDAIVPFLKKRLEEFAPKVSYVKDIIRLILLLSDRKGRTEFCLECWDKHKHYSIRSTVLYFVSQLFIEQSTQESFRVLEKCILECDEITIEALPELRRIPREYLNDYVNTLWRFSETLKPTSRAGFRDGLVQELNEKNIMSLSAEFCEGIIKNHLFHESSEIKVKDFAVAYLVSNHKSAESRAFTVLDLIKVRKPEHYSVYELFSTLISNRGKTSNFFDLLRIILENWPEYPLGILYEERVLFTYHYLDQKVLKKCGDCDGTPVEFGKELKQFYSGVENLADLIPIYAAALKEFFCSYPTHKVVLVLKELVAGSQNKTVALLSILSMPTDAVCCYTKKYKNAKGSIEETKKGLDEFVKILESYDDEVVEIHLRSKLEFVKM